LHVTQLFLIRWPKTSNANTDTVTPPAGLAEPREPAQYGSGGVRGLIEQVFARFAATGSARQVVMGVAADLSTVVLNGTLPSDRWACPDRAMP